jgi:hypothetical protein
LPALADLFRGRYLACGTDFASIRVHYGGADVDLACRALGARAFTVGSDIYFAAGAFRPDTRDGLWLLAHEVAHVVQQSAGLVRTSRTSGAPRTAAGVAGRPALMAASAATVAPPGTAEERAADAAADALVTGRPFVFSGVGTGAGTTARVGQAPVVQRYMAWEHSLLGDLDPARVQATAAGATGYIGDYRNLLAELGREAQQVDEARVRAGHPGLDTVRLPGSGLVVTLGELNVLPDYLGRPEEIEAAPRAPVRRTAESASLAAAAPAAWVAALSAARPAGRDRRDSGDHRARQAPRVRARQSVRLGPGAQRHPFRPVLVVPLALMPPDGPGTDRALRDRERR